MGTGMSLFCRDGKINEICNSNKTVLLSICIYRSWEIFYSKFLKIKNGFRDCTEAAIFTLKLKFYNNKTKKNNGK